LVQISPLFWAFALFCPQFSHPPDTRPYGRVSGVGWPPILMESRVLDIGWTPEFRRKSRVSGVGCPSGAIAWCQVSYFVWGSHGFATMCKGYFNLKINPIKILSQ
jgi:hypothetical protein